MKKYLITFRSITLAQRGERALQQAGIHCHIRRTPRWMEKKGCGYALEVRLTDISQGLSVLRGQGIAYRKSYQMTQDDTVEELAP